MSTRIPTVNVLLSYFLEPLIQLHEGSKSLEELKSKGRDGIFLFGNDTTSNLLEFEHSGGTRISDNASEFIKIDIIDPSFEFERAFANTNFSDMVPRIFKSSQFLSNTKREKAEVEHQKKIDEFKKHLVESGFFTNFAPEFKSSRNEALELGSEDKTDEELLLELDAVSLPETTIIGSGSRGFWITYGIGDNFKEWCAPLKVILTSINYSYNNGSRVLSLGLVSTEYITKGKITDIFGNNINELKTKVIARSIPFIKKKDWLFLTKDKKKALPGKVIRLSTKHEMFESLVIDYLSKIFKTDRIIAVLPNIDILFPNKEKGVTNSQLNEILKEKKRGNLKYLKELDPILLLGRELKLFFTKIGVGIITPQLADPDIKAPAHERVPIPYDKPDALFIVDFNIFVDNSTTPLYTVLEKLKENSEYFINWNLHIQSNINFIKIFEKHKLVEEENSEPVIIFGDSDLIRKYLYCDIILEELGDLGRKSSNYLVEDIANKVYNIEYQTDILSIRPDAVDTEIVDTFFNPIDEKDFGILKKLKLPVFKFGVKNPNILNMEMIYKNIFLDIYHSLPVMAQSQITSWGIGKPNKEYFRTINKEDRIKLVKLLKNIFEGSITNTGYDLPVDFIKLLEENISEEEFADKISFYLSNMSKNNPKTIAVLDELMGDTAFSYSLRVLNEIYSRPLVLDIDTLPMFWLSNYSIIGVPSILFSLEPRIMGITDNFPIQSVFTGVYQIMGFTHKISNNKVESSFDIVKNIGNLRKKEIEENNIITDKNLDK